MHIKQDDLLIRNAEARDADQLCAWWNDGAVMAHAGFPNGLGTTPEAIRESLRGDNDRSRRCIIELDGTPVGEMNYRDKGERTAEIGIKICDASQRERGHGTKLLTMFIGELFCRYGFDRIILDTNLKNTRAQHVYEKLGFRRLRTEYGSWKNQVGELQSQLYYELYGSDWHGDRLLNYLCERFPEADAFLLGGSSARGDGIGVRDLDVRVVLPGAHDPREGGNGDFIAERALDISYASRETLDDTERLLRSAYEAGFYADALLLCDKTGKMQEYLSDYRLKYPKLEYHAARVAELTHNLEAQYNALNTSEDEVGLWCAFGSYAWTLCDALLVRNLRSPSWIRGLQKLCDADSEAAAELAEAEGGSGISESAVTTLLGLYGELWEGWTVGLFGPRDGMPRRGRTLRRHLSLAAVMRDYGYRRTRRRGRLYRKMESCDDG